MGVQNLQELFSFQIAYKKYPKLVAGLFQIEPTEGGAKTLQRYGLYFKAQQQGFVIVAPGVKDSASGLVKVQTPFIDGEKLAFVAFTSDPEFYDRSELPEETPGTYVYYFNNVDATARRTKLLLDNCGVKSGQRMPLHTKVFAGKLARDANNQIILPSVTDCRGNTVAATGYDWTVDEFQKSYTLDLTRMKDGVYTVAYNGAATTAYCTKASLIRRNPLLILEVFLDEAVAAAYQVVKRVEGVQYLQTQKFHLYFGSYYYYWRYKIIPVNTPDYSWLALTTTPSDVSFTPTQIAINSYRDAVTFTSNTLIDAPNNDLTLNLCRLDWTGLCRYTDKKQYQYCDHAYGVWSDNQFWCRELEKKKYAYRCPAAATKVVVGQLPKTTEIATAYTTEDGKSYAEMTLYLVYANGKYTIQEKYEPVDYSCRVTETDGDVTITFISKNTMTYVDLYYLVVDRVSQQCIRMNQIEKTYSMEKLLTRFNFSKLVAGERIVYWFVYKLLSSDAQTTTYKSSHIFGKAIKRSEAIKGGLTHGTTGSQTG